MSPGIIVADTIMCKTYGVEMQADLLASRRGSKDADDRHPVNGRPCDLYINAYVCGQQDEEDDRFLTSITPQRGNRMRTEKTRIPDVETFHRTGHVMVHLNK